MEPSKDAPAKEILTPSGLKYVDQKVGPGAEAKAETRKIFNAERKALQVMGLGSDATLETVKAKYKALVKQHHPDANGGDRSTEDRLIEIIKAYNYLKTVVRGAS